MSRVTREERKGRNEVWFRDVNEQLEVRALGRPGTTTAFDAVCECSKEECTQRIAISYEAYEEVRETPTRFLVAEGHSDPTVERVVVRKRGYEIVEKHGEAALVAASDDPRH